MRPQRSSVLADNLHRYPTRAEVAGKAADACHRTGRTPAAQRLFERWR